MPDKQSPWWVYGEKPNGEWFMVTGPRTDYQSLGEMARLLNGSDKCGCNYWLSPRVLAELSAEGG